MGLRPTQGDEKRVLYQQLLLLEAPPCPLSSRPEKSWAFGPPKVMKNTFCSATTLNGSAALPFVISTGAPKERSGEICGVSGPFLGMFFDRAPKACGPRKVAIRHLNVVPAGDLLVAA
jgi:hypothetical protein